jgi:hypothetical protein
MPAPREEDANRWCPESCRGPEPAQEAEDKWVGHYNEVAAEKGYEGLALTRH